MSIENAKITSVSITMADYGCLTFLLTLDGGAWEVNFGGYCIGHGYMGAEKFDATDRGLTAMMRIMDTVGVEKWEDLVGKYCRVDIGGLGEPIYRIGNILTDKWFDINEHFKEDSE